MNVIILTGRLTRDPELNFIFLNKYKNCFLRKFLV